ncbi:MAG: ATP-dependent dethiobiotin synthetase BioD [Bacteroidales bacterium]|nr:ATP-dependent dethiobiotin synthetase BioD [Bacteroidales bacterium]MDE6256985.1 dethiobiotin synthase [Muribaculaceae bacterium]
MELTADIKFPQNLFITGIDTDAGKSFATGWLARLIMSRNKSVITQKFVQTGNQEYSEDIEVHRRIMGIPMTKEDVEHITAPVIFTYPASPDLAAKLDGKEIDFEAISNATKTLDSRYDHVLIEGAGGLMVPLKGDYLTIDYIREHKLPVVLVTNGRLGSINHTLLSLKAIADENIELFAVLYNTYFDKDKIICEDTKQYIRNWLSSRFPQSLYLEF